jgi:hypothetical protein
MRSGGNDESPPSLGSGPLPAQRPQRRERIKLVIAAWG